MERRLAAILAADVVGYTRLMGKNEAATLEHLKAHRAELFEPLIIRHHGRTVKLMGDGMLAEFSSVVHAVSCAADLQRGMAERNADVPEEDRIQFRIGVNLGDLIIEGDDLYGDGMNVAARLEGLADPGGICVSAKVYEEVRTKLDLRFQDLGLHELKNIAEPIRVYRISPISDLSIASPVKKVTKTSLDRVSIAVLPFDNMSGDPEQRYFSDGITEDIITELSRFASLEVVARNSTFVYRDKANDISALGRALGATFLLEGSLRKAGNRIRLTAQLINVSSGGHVWAERYDRNLEDIFAIQDELVHAIVATLADRLTTAETARSMRKPAESLLAYDYYLKALNLDRNYDRESCLEARELLRKAVELDPTFARAHGLLSAEIWTVGRFDSLFGRTHLDEAVQVARRAVQLDPDDGFCNSMLATAYFHAGNHEQSRHYHELAMALNPHDSFIWSDYAAYLICVGDCVQALGLLTRREAIEPIPPDWHWSIRGQALYGLGRWHDAIAAFERPAAVPPRIHGYLAACYGQLGDKERAHDHWANFVDCYPDARPNLIGELHPYKNQADKDRWMEGLRKAGIND